MIMTLQKQNLNDEAKKLYQFGYKEILPRIKRAVGEQDKSNVVHQ